MPRANAAPHRKVSATLVSTRLSVALRSMAVADASIDCVIGAAFSAALLFLHLGTVTDTDIVVDCEFITTVYRAPPDLAAIFCTAEERRLCAAIDEGIRLRRARMLRAYRGSASLTVSSRPRYAG